MLFKSILAAEGQDNISSENQDIFQLDTNDLVSLSGSDKEKNKDKINENIPIWLKAAGVKNSMKDVKKYFEIFGEDIINTSLEDGVTALMLAADYQNIDIFKYLVENGADLDVKDKQNHTVVYFIHKKGKGKSREVAENFISILFKEKNDNTQVEPVKEKQDKIEKVSSKIDDRTFANERVSNLRNVASYNTLSTYVNASKTNVLFDELDNAHNMGLSNEAKIESHDKIIQKFIIFGLLISFVFFNWLLIFNRKFKENTKIVVDSDGNILTEDLCGCTVIDENGKPKGVCLETNKGFLCDKKKKSGFTNRAMMFFCLILILMLIIVFNIYRKKNEKK